MCNQFMQYRIFFLSFIYFFFFSYYNVCIMIYLNSGMSALEGVTVHFYNGRQTKILNNLIRHPLSVKRGTCTSNRPIVSLSN